MNAPFPVVILSGGLGTRLYPITEKIPKTLVNIQGEPFIAHQLRFLKSQNISSVVLCLGYLGEMVKEFLSSREWNVNLSYSFDGDKLLGTAGAVKKAFPYLPETFFVLYGDSYLQCNFSKVQKVYLAKQKKALMTVFKNDGQFDKSNIIFQNEKIIAYDKNNLLESMNYIDYGLGVFHKSAFDLIPNHVHYDLANLYQNLLLKNELSGYEVRERFYEVGSFSGIDELSMFLNKTFF